MDENATVILPDPITRQEMYLSYLNGNTDIVLPAPVTRIDMYLYELCINGTGGGGGQVYVNGNEVYY